MRTITDVEDLKTSVSRRLVLFAWVGWSPCCHRSKSVVLSGLDTSEGLDPRYVDLALVDLTDQAGDVWETLAAWLREQPGINALAYMFSAAGAVAWIREGHVVNWVPNAGLAGAKTIVEFTWSLQPESDLDRCRARPASGWD